MLKKIKNSIITLKKEVSLKKIDFFQKWSEKNMGKREKFFNKCIYCGTTNGLTDEHALAYGFNGLQILRNASCKECAKITSAFEAKILRGPFADYRYFKNYKSRSKNKALSKKRFYFIKDKKSNVKKIEFDLDIVGSCLFIPEFNKPSIKQGMEDIKINDIHYIIMNNKEKSLPKDVAEILFEQNFLMEEYIRFLTKIAYCYTCLSFDPEEIKPYVLPLILNGDKKAWHYVGSEKQNIFIENDKGVKIFNKNGIIYCCIKLFVESPVVYGVIVGKKIHDNIILNLLKLVKYRVSLLIYVLKNIRVFEQKEN